MTKLYRQGDVLLKPSEKIPEGAKPSEDRILVRGETTGHAHRAHGQQLQVFRTPDNRMYLEGKGQLIHEEHKTIEIPEGTYEVVRQEEYSPVENRQVAD